MHVSFPSAIEHLLTLKNICSFTLLSSTFTTEMVPLLTPLNSPVAFRALREYFYVLVLHFPWGHYG